MTGIALIDVAISLIFLFLVLSLICSALQEAVATGLSARSENLWQGVENLLNDPKTDKTTHGLMATLFFSHYKTLWRGLLGLLNPQPVAAASGTGTPAAAGALVEDETLAGKVYRHPLIKKLAKDGKKPSYIPARTFALALLDTIKDPNAQGGALAEAATSVKNLPDGDIKTALATLIADAQGNVEKARKNIETWFDDSMDRVAGWYKRHSQYWMVFYAFLIAMSLNVDTLQVVRVLYDNP